MRRPAELETIGLIPAAGKAARLSPLPCSKEIFPVGFHEAGTQLSGHPKVACHYLLEKMHKAGVSEAYMILRSGKWDIPSYFGDGEMLSMHLAYLMMRLPYGVPYSLDQAYPFVKDKIVVIGFPDILFSTKDAFVRLLQKLNSTKDAVLGLFHSDEPWKKDMIDIFEDGRIRKIVKKPKNTVLHYTWSIAVWTPNFTRFMHEYVASAAIANKKTPNGSAVPSDQEELTLGEVLQAGIESGLKLEGVIFDHDNCVDIGTPLDLLRATEGAQNENHICGEI